MVCRKGGMSALRRATWRLCVLRSGLGRCVMQNWGGEGLGKDYRNGGKDYRNELAGLWVIRLLVTYKYNI